MRAVEARVESDVQRGSGANAASVPWSDTAGSMTEGQVTRLGWLFVDELGRVGRRRVTDSLPALFRRPPSEPGVR